jgi:DNA topoisomerase-2
MPPKKTTATEAVSKYVKLDQREHVLLRPSTYIGSVEEDTVATWVFDGTKMTKREIKYIPALYKIYDEIIVNVLDHVVRLKQASGEVRPVKKIAIDIDQQTGVISVFNDGDGIDIEKHPEYDIYMPELILGNMLTSSNYDDTEERIIGGMNGIGAKACNIFSQFFEIETVDAKRKKIYTQRFTENMSVKSVPVVKACAKTPYTKITFLPDYARFKCPGLSPDMYALMFKRAVDCCALTENDVKVFFNGNKLEAKNFETYADLYLGGKSDHKRHYEKVNDRWELIVADSCIGSDDASSVSSSVSSGSFDQISFVNGIWTLRGGKHVDYIVNQVVKKVGEVIAKKKKDIIVKPQAIRDSFVFFIKAVISNPTFDSQTKETLTTPMTKFGSKCEVSEKLIAKLCTSGLIERLTTISSQETEKALKKTDGKKRSTLRGIPKLDDANWAGTGKSSECTLILTEGDSAKSMAIAGLSVVGRDKYGVFPLRGKILNVKDCADSKITANEELAALKKILGLESGKKYDNVETLRYGRIMVMTDQDQDGFHIKGLLFNVFHTLWPSLMKTNGFLSSMLTPIVKAKRISGSKETLSFYNLTDYKNWLQATVNPTTGQLSGWEIKYYKGLGTSNSAEAKDYFRELKTLEYNYSGASSSEAIDLAFNKKRADDRKEWICNYNRQSVIDYNHPQVDFKDYVDKELIHFSVYNLERAIPSVCDGLKRSLRKILYCCFKRNLVKEIRVAQLAGYVSEHGAYHHGEASLQEAIIGMAQNFVGSNNINLLMPNGQFGTRLEGGKDSASPRYIHTELNPIAFKVFSKLDTEVLNFLEEDGEQIEPEHYLPVVPMVLINGASGIGTGFSTSIPQYNPTEIVRVLRQMLATCSSVETDLSPWYHGFKGTIERDTANSYVSRGLYTKVAENKIEITELPIGTWTSDYKEFLETYIEKNPKVLKDYESHYTESNVHFVLHFQAGVLAELLTTEDKNGRPKFENEFKLSSNKGLQTGNMHLYDEHGVIRLYSSAMEIIENFYRVRLGAYTTRKERLVAKLEKELLYLRAKARFILEVIAKKLIVFDVKKDVIITALKTGEYPENEGSYDYLVKMPIYSLTQERKEELLKEVMEKEMVLEALREQTPQQLWLADLNDFETAYLAYTRARDTSAEVSGEQVQTKKANKTKKMK